MRGLNYAVLMTALVAADPVAAQPSPPNIQPKPQFVSYQFTRNFNGQRADSEESDIDPPPTGYTTCNAHLIKTRALADNMNFRPRIVRNQQRDGLAWTAAMMKGAPGSMIFDYEVTYVLGDDPKAVVEFTKQGVCQPNNFCPFQVSHWDSKNLKIFNCAKEDKTVDRWCGNNDCK